MAAVETKLPASPFSADTLNTLPTYIAIEPRQLVFQDDSETSSTVMRIINISHLRVAFRIRSNAPTRYIVMPATGFLTANEGINVRVTNPDMKKYRRRHRFMIQAMEAKENDKDRKKIWNDSRAEDLDLVQCIRVLTLKVKKQRPESLSHGRSQSPILEASESETSTSRSRTTDKEQSARIDELNKLINDEMEKKRKESQSLVEAVNEVKKIEVELDRANVQCKDLNKKIIFEENQQKIIKEKITKMDSVLETLKNETK